MDNQLSSVALLTPVEMQFADLMTAEAGTSGHTLMERAGRAVADAAKARLKPGDRVAILAGPGNNGGDAFVAGRVLRNAGFEVSLYLLGGLSDPSGDAATAARAFGAMPEAVEAFEPAKAEIVVDGLFGAGLSRIVEGEGKAAIERANDSGTPVVAIDLPSGVSGLSGEALGTAIHAAVTVTFFRRKPGHLLEPGRSRCGEVVVADIGIDPAILKRIGPKTFANEPPLWKASLPQPSHVGHKYDRGHAVVFSGGASKTGAARLSATAALRIGAGLVTVFSPASALMINAMHLTAVMLGRCEDGNELRERLGDGRLNAFVIGPGFGIGEKAEAFVGILLDAGRHVVIDADAISSFKDRSETLFEAIGASRGWTVLTPHAGEFARLFPDIAKGPGSKLDKTRQAASRSGAVVVFKGPDTVIAAPDGRAAINGTGSPYLATAGTGDVLAGMIGGLLAQKAPAFEAACAAVWMHGMAGIAHGPGLIAEDLPGGFPTVLRTLWA